MLHFRFVAKAINNVNNIKMWRCDNMGIKEFNSLVDDLKKHMDDWDLYMTCEKCGVAIIVGPQGDPRNYLYPQPDFPNVPETMEILCHDCYAHAFNEDQAARYGCGTCGEPVEDTKFQNENGFLCKKCLAEILG